jgi:cytoskeletal protein CcmA (bactofilin family)
MVFSRKPDQRSDFTSVSSVAAASPAVSPLHGQPQGATETYAGPVPVEAQSVIGNDLSIEGQSITIRCKGSLRINGNIQADLHSRQLTVGEDAQIQGSIAADVVDVYGRVSGAIMGARVVLHRTALVEGDIHSRSLSIEDGASFDGRSRKVADAQSVAPQLEPTNGSHTGRSESTILMPPRMG